MQILLKGFPNCLRDDRNVSIGLGDGLMQNKWQAITWANDDRYLIV